MKLLIIGSDSFIARNFVNFYQNSFEFTLISRVQDSNSIVITDFFSIPDNLFSGHDVVVNFAAIVHQAKLKNNSIYTEINHKLVIANAIKARRAKVGLFIQMSTVAVYGNAQLINLSTPCNPVNLYGISKLQADLELLTLEKANFKVAIVRSPMVYGGGNAPGNMMKLIRLALKGVPLPFSGVNNRRDFININNLCQYLYLIAIKNLHGTFLISDRQSVSTEQIIRTIAKQVPVKIHLFKPPSIITFLLKIISPTNYYKLFGSLIIETNFPYENLIEKHSFESGISEMITCREIS